MSKKLERLRSELLSEDKITNLLGFLTKDNPGGQSIYRVKNSSPQIRILTTYVQCVEEAEATSGLLTNTMEICGHHGFKIMVYRNNSVK